MEWKDTTSYSQGKERIQSAWSLETSEIRITVMNKHIHYPNKWIMHCFRLGMKEVELKIPFESNTECAQIEALNLVGRELDGIQKTILSALIKSN